MPCPLQGPQRHAFGIAFVAGTKEWHQNQLLEKQVISHSCQEGCMFSSHKHCHAFESRKRMFTEFQRANVALVAEDVARLVEH